MKRLTTAKAYAAAIMASLAAVLTVTTPFLGDGAAGRWAYAVLAVLAAMGVTYRVPNRGPMGSVPIEGGTLTGPADMLPTAAAELGGALGPVTHAAQSTVGRVLDAVPALLGGALDVVRGGDDGPREPDTF